MDFLMKLSTFGKFSVKETPSGIVVKQTDYLNILIKFFVFGLIILAAAMQIQHQGIASLQETNKANYVIELITALAFFYMVFKNIAAGFKKKARLIINLIERSIDYNGFNLKTEKINYADVGKIYYGKVCRYYLVIYLKDNNDSDKEMMEKNIFTPTSLSKGFIIFLANEINKLTTDIKMVNNKNDKLEIVGNAYLILATIVLTPIFLVVAYVLIFYY